MLQFLTRESQGSRPPCDAAGFSLSHPPDPAAPDAVEAAKADIELSIGLLRRRL
jgi:hypothetical protein